MTQMDWKLFWGGPGGSRPRLETTNTKKNRKLPGKKFLQISEGFVLDPDNFCWEEARKAYVWKLAEIVNFAQKSDGEAFGG